MTSIRTRALRHPVSLTRGGRLRLRALMVGALACALLSACTGQMRPQSPVTAAQRSELDKLAASKDAPEGLKDALAGVDAYEKRRACRDQSSAVARQMQMLGMANAATLTAGRMGGRATTTAAKMVAVMNAQTVKTQVSQLQNCANPKS